MLEARAGYGNGRHPDINDPNAYVLYRYSPNLVAAIVFVVVFSITTFLHVFQIVKKRTWYFIPLAVGGASRSPQAYRQLIRARYANTAVSESGIHWLHWAYTESL